MSDDRVDVTKIELAQLGGGGGVKAAAVATGRSSRSRSNQQSEPTAVERMFREADTDGSGGLDADEIAGLCKQMGNKLSKGGLKAAMAEMDADGSGVVSFDEFNGWWGANGGKALAKFPAANPLRLSDESDDDDGSDREGK